MALETIEFADDPQFAYDEDIIKVIGNDFGRIVFDSQKLAGGADGIVQASTPFTLTSATVNFSDRGVTAGRVIRLTGAPGTTPGKAIQRAYGSEEYGVVSAVAGTQITLRRAGATAGTGQSFAPTLVTLTEVYFNVSTFDPQLISATTEIRDRLREYEDDDDIAERLTDEPLKLLTIAWALSPVYRVRITPIEAGSTATQDPYEKKADQFEAERKMRLKEVMNLARGSGVVVIA